MAPLRASGTRLAVGLSWLYVPCCLPWEQGTGHRPKPGGMRDGGSTWLGLTDRRLQLPSKAFGEAKFLATQPGGEGSGCLPSPSGMPLARNRGDHDDGYELPARGRREALSMRALAVATSVLDGRRSAKLAKLRYVTDEGPGIRRERRGRGVRYIGSSGSPVRTSPCSDGSSGWRYPPPGPTSGSVPTHTATSRPSGGMPRVAGSTATTSAGEAAGRGKVRSHARVLDGAAEFCRGVARTSGCRACRAIGSGHRCPPARDDADLRRQRRIP